MPLLTIFLLKFSVLVHVFFVFVFAFENVFVFLFSRSVQLAEVPLIAHAFTGVLVLVNVFCICICMSPLHVFIFLVFVFIYLSQGGSNGCRFTPISSEVSSTKMFPSSPQVCRTQDLFPSQIQGTIRPLIQTSFLGFM